ncbi:MAG: effector binding domain-containing protein [Bacteroidota bacterium]
MKITRQGILLLIMIFIGISACTKAEVGPGHSAVSKLVHSDTLEQPNQVKLDFYIIGLQAQVPFDDTQKQSQVIEKLWTQLYEKDVSNFNNRIIDPEKIYTVYSNYGQPKGQMTITLGYQIGNSSAVSTPWSIVQVPKNKYWAYPLSGKESDYTGPAWKQIEELIPYRSKATCDFEIYQLDENYEVTAASIWIAEK